MQHISPEQKLALIHQIRWRYHHDRDDFVIREQYLNSAVSSELPLQRKPVSFFTLRLILSILFLLILLLSDQKEEFLSLLAKDYYEMAELFVSENILK